jgi:asparagine synthase (glutamine-hydrolysing)
VRIVCGICGVIQVSGSPRQVVSPETLDRMTDVMRHRGPNDRGTYQVDGVALGVRRLSIIDVEDGHQPVANETSSIVAVQNGELFNHDEVRKQLVARGHALQTRCDTEILPHLYEEAGDDLGQRLNGMFAIALWDGPRRRGLVVRDRLGVKPLYYAEVGDLLVFGSELKAVLASCLVSEELDWEAIDTYLRLGFIPAPRTPFAAVSKLLPGCRLVVERGRVVEERWWSYPAQDPRSSGLTMRENAAALLELLEDSVRLELMSDVPLGVMLSGGLDSSLLAALMSRNLSDPVQTFSVGFAEDAQSSELDDARAVASVIGARHHELKLSIDEVELDLGELLWHLDEPIADLSTLGFHALCKLAAEHVTVALCGQGPDELYGGYDKHRAAAMLRPVGFLPGPLRAAVTGPLALGGARLSRIARTARAGTPTDRLLAMSGIADTELRRSLVRGQLASLDGQSARRAIERVAPPGAADRLSETLFMDGQLALPDDMLHFTDRMSMAHSLEVRVPYLDYRLVEHSARIPSNQKVRGLTTKVVLKEAARGVIPDEIIDKRKIGFFGHATNAWLNRHLDGALGNYLLDPGARYVEFLDRGAVERLVRSHSARTEKQGDRLLLAILMLEIWLSSYLPQSGRSSDRPVSTGIVT